MKVGKFFGSRILRASKFGEDLGSIEISIMITSKSTTLNDGSLWLEYASKIEVNSRFFRWSNEFLGTDELQVICRALRVGGAYIWKVCSDNRIAIYSLEPGDISSEDGVFFA